MTRWIWTGLVAGLLLASAAHAQEPATFKAKPPELAHQAEGDWINSQPLKLGDLHGRVVVLHFWTFG